MNMPGEQAYQSPLVHLDPAAKVLMSGVPFLTCLVSRSFLVALATLVLMVALAARFAAVTRKAYLQLLSIPAGFILIGTASILIQVFPADQTLLMGVALGHSRIGISRQGLLDAVFLVMRSMACISTIYFVMLTTPLLDLLELLRRWHCPRLILSLMELIYRFIFILLDEARRMHIAQVSRLGDASFVVRLQSAGILIGQLFLRAYLRSDRIYQAMSARGYSGVISTLPKTYVRSWQWLAWSAWTGLILVSLALLERQVTG